MECDVGVFVFWVRTATTGDLLLHLEMAWLFVQAGSTCAVQLSAFVYVIFKQAYPFVLAYQGSPCVCIRMCLYVWCVLSLAKAQIEFLPNSLLLLGLVLLAVLGNGGVLHELLSFGHLRGL